MINWYCATTLPFGELQAEKHLKDQGFDPFLPKCEVTTLSRNSERTTRRPYIVGYIFFPWDLADPKWRVINSTRGIRQIMYGAHEKPAPIRQDAMQVLLDRCNGSIVKREEIDRAISKVIWKDAEVRVTDGPLMGLRGKVTWSDNDRVKVLMSLFGRPSDVELSKKNLEVVT